ncbi:hypothetical protein PtA15_13A170 [Puccinia triticina]|uniref:Uncharacterized protein n=1 Tax=Puccinia triticina TaxID=208348 RepID=A0ABY7CZM1_9BASI|nr:uncharacterized protein PtA15_13A170 [Puccinia triticina]WAQ90771.1 hypothetical protein PtA15_13A170 [Puccinia triticina]
MHRIHRVCTQAHELFRQIQLAPQEVRPNKFDGCSYRENFIKGVRLASRSIDATIQVIASSELNLAQHQWAVELPRMHKTIWGIINTTNRLQTKRVKGPRSLQLRQAAELAKHSVPMLKLIRMFFNKISTHGINRGRFPTYTKMSSEQIDSLSHSLTAICEDLGVLKRLFQKIEETGLGAATGREVIEIANKMTSGLETTLPLVLLHCVPLIKDTEHFESRDYYKTWFATWNTAFDSATNSLAKILARLPYNN